MVSLIVAQLTCSPAGLPLLTLAAFHPASASASHSGLCLDLTFCVIADNTLAGHQAVLKPHLMYTRFFRGNKSTD
jgi:hypothetical protein